MGEIEDLIRLLQDTQGDNPPLPAVDAEVQWRTLKSVQQATPEGPVVPRSEVVPPTLREGSPPVAAETRRVSGTPAAVVQQSSTSGDPAAPAHVQNVSTAGASLHTPQSQPAVPATIQNPEQVRSGEAVAGSLSARVGSLAEPNRPVSQQGPFASVYRTAPMPGISAEVAEAIQAPGAAPIVLPFEFVKGASATPTPARQVGHTGAVATGQDQYSGPPADVQFILPRGADASAWFKEFHSFDNRRMMDAIVAPQVPVHSDPMPSMSESIVPTAVRVAEQFMWQPEPDGRYTL